MKESVESLGSDGGNYLKSGLDTAEDLGSDAGNYLKNGASQISDAVN